MCIRDRPYAHLRTKDLLDYEKRGETKDYSGKEKDDDFHTGYHRLGKAMVASHDHTVKEGENANDKQLVKDKAV